MKRIIYSSEVLGLDSVWYDLHNENKSLHDEFMKEIFKLGHLVDITDVFHPERDQEFIEMANGFVVIDGKTYTFDSSDKKDEIRSDDQFHGIIEKYNQKLNKPKKILYKDVPDDRYPYMSIVRWEDGSEQIFFSN